MSKTVKVVPAWVLPDHMRALAAVEYSESLPEGIYLGWHPDIINTRLIPGRNSWGGYESKEEETIVRPYMHSNYCILTQTKIRLVNNLFHFDSVLPTYVVLLQDRETVDGKVPAK